jgi:putative membrane protein
MRNRCALLVMCAAAACASQGSEAAERQFDTTGQRDSIAAVAAASMDEAQVLGLLDQVHAADSALGALGGAQGSTREIKDFGLMITREHHALRRDVQEVAEGLRLVSQAPTVRPDEASTAFRENLAATPPGAGWDRAYVEYAIAVHDAAMENTARALAATKSPTTRELIRKSVPILQKHLDKARSLQKSLARAEPATAPARSRETKSDTTTAKAATKGTKAATKRP